MGKYTHKGQILPLVNQMVPISQYTTFHADYDFNLNGFNQEELVTPTMPARGLGFDNGFVYFGDMEKLEVPPNDITLSFWYRKTNGYLNILGDKDGVSAAFTVAQDPSKTNFKLTKYGVIDIYIGTVPTDEGWHAISVVYSSIDGVMLYLDGELHATHPNTSDFSNAYWEFPGIGRAEYGFFTGMVSEFSLWNRALSAEEIAANTYRQLNGNEEGLIGYWRLNEKEGPVSFDRSPKQNDGMWSGNVSPSKGGTIASITEGKFRNGVLIEEGTVNQIDPAIWSNQEPSEWQVEQLDQYKFKITALVDAPASWHYGTCSDRAWTAANTTATMSVRVVERSNPNLTIAAAGFGANENVVDGERSVRTITYSLDWEHRIATDCYDNGVSIKAGDYIIIEYAQIEHKAYATSFIDGSRGEGKLCYPKKYFTPEAFTVSFWVKCSHFLSWNGLFSVDHTGGSHGERFAIRYDSQELKVLVGHGTETIYIPGDFIPQKEEWNMITVSFDGVTYSLYANGELVGQMDAPPPAINQSATINVGNLYYQYGGTVIDELRIESRAISSEEARAWATSGIHYNYLNYSERVD